MNYVIMTDSSADLPWAYYKEHDVPYIPMTVVMGDKTFADDGSFDAHDFFVQLAQGARASTSQIPVGSYIDAFEKYLEQGKDILFMGLSKKMSESYSNACIARDEVLTKYPERKVHVCASSCASLGIGLFINEAVKRRDGGMDFDALCDWAEDFYPTIHHLVTVHDLEFLHRGGRISKTSAVVGHILGIKPMIDVSLEGQLQTIGKIRGRKQSIKAMFDNMCALVPEGVTEISTVAISHGDCLDEARELMALVKSKYKVGDEIFHPLGITIGAHIGPGTIALFFYGKRRV